MKQINILISDSNQLILDGMAALLNNQPNLTVSGTATNCSEVMLKLSRYMPDICILNLEMPGIDIFQISENLRQQGLNTGIIAITQRCEPSLRKRIYASGIKACLINPFDVGELLFAITKVANGENYFYPFNAEMLNG